MVFITDVESVYSAVRTESLYKTDMLLLERVNAHWLIYKPPRVILKNLVSCPHSAFMCLVRISEHGGEGGYFPSYY
jgi:hypothetical protein